MKILIGIRVKETLAKDIKIQAIKENKNVSELMEELIEKYLKEGK